MYGSEALVCVLPSGTRRAEEGLTRADQSVLCQDRKRSPQLGQVWEQFLQHAGGNEEREFRV